MNLEEKLVKKLSKPIDDATDKEIYEACVDLVQDEIISLPKIHTNKKVYYISAEFLVGKQLGKDLINLGMYNEMLEIMEKHNRDFIDIERREKEPSLGNGGLGRLAACFLDSIATLNLEGDGIGLNYHFGLFNLLIEARVGIRIGQTSMQERALEHPRPKCSLYIFRILSDLSLLRAATR